MSGPGVLVTGTRFQQWRDLLVLLAPIFTPGDAAAKAYAIKRFAKALRRRSDAEADMARVEALCKRTRAEHWPRLHAAYGIAPLPPPPEDQALDLSHRAQQAPHGRKRARVAA